MKTNASNCIDILESYIKGKDQNEYKILEHIYTESAELAFEIESDTISFPSNISGNLEIARVLSKDFNQQYTRVKTYYLAAPQKDQLIIKKQKWLVVMQDKLSKNKNENHKPKTRVGCGYYDWDLINAKNDDGVKIKKHKITIHSMLQFEDNQNDELKRIQSVLAYPWVDIPTVIETLNIHSKYAEIIQYLNTK